MKKALLFLLIAALACGLLFRADPKGGDVEYMQKVLQAPDRITVQLGASTAEYPKDSEEYWKLYDAMNRTWFHLAQGKPETASLDALYMAATPKELKATTDRTYAENDDLFVCFLYEEGFPWYEKKGDPLMIRQITFLVPERTATQDHVRGAFTVSQSESIGSNEGWFTQYYPAEMVNGFWDWLN